jgi:DNA-binding transcriptional regulator PaaX
MNLVYEILKDLSTSSLRYKGGRVNFFGIPKFKNYSQNSLSGTLSRLRKESYIDDTNLELKITLKGQKYIKRKMDSLKQFDFKFNIEAPRNLIVMFDIPETKKAEREWLRWHLKKFNYSMIQKSVWVGPSPLPKEFLDYIEKIKIKDGFKTFKLAKGYNFEK